MRGVARFVRNAVLPRTPGAIGAPRAYSVVGRPRKAVPANVGARQRQQRGWGSDASSPATCRGSSGDIYAKAYALVVLQMFLAATNLRGARKNDAL